MNIEKVKGDEVFMTSSTRMATMLLFCGHTLRRPPCSRQVRRDGKTIVTFLFDPASESGIETCAKLALRWMELEQRDPYDNTPEDLQRRLSFAAELATSDDPVSRCYANAIWRDVAISIVKATPRVVEYSREGRTAYFREDATPEEIKQMSKYL